MRARIGLAVLALALTLSCRSAHADDPEHKLDHDGRTRTYRLHVPPSTGEKKLPLLFCLHGGGGTGEGQVKLTKGRFDALADEKGFLVCYPDGVEKGWNDGREMQGRAAAKREGLDDVGFISSLIDTISHEHAVDSTRVYSTGMSNGAFMSYRLGVDLSDRIAAIAPVDGNLWEEIQERAKKGRPVPLLAINGMDDPIVPWAGGEVHVGPLKRGKCLPVADSIRIWCERNHAAPEATKTKLPDKDPADTTHVLEEEHKPLSGGAEVILLAVEGGGHTWPNGMQYLPELAIGRTTHQIDGATVVWEFLSRHTLPVK